MPIQPPSYDDQCTVADQVLQVMGEIHLLAHQQLPSEPETELMPFISVLTFSAPASLTLTLECSAELASSLACIFFELSPHEVQHSELADTVTELVNMIGGNLKGLMPADTVLGLPEIIRAQSREMFGPTLSSAHLATSAGDLRLTFS